MAATRVTGLTGFAVATGAGVAVTVGEGVAMTIGGGATGIGAAPTGAGAAITGLGAANTGAGPTKTGAGVTVLPAVLWDGFVAPAGNEFVGCGTCDPAPGDAGLCAPPVWAIAAPAIKLTAAADINKVLRILYSPWNRSKTPRLTARYGSGTVYCATGSLAGQKASSVVRHASEPFT